MLRHPPLLSLFLLSALTLCFEILLIRLFSIIQWHHFAYMVISLALLGYGISGTFITIAFKTLRRNCNEIYVGCIFCFAITSLTSFLVAQHIPFNAEEIFWNPKQLLFLLAIFLILTVPFFFAASGICLILSCYRNYVSRIYGYDLLGAGIGSIVVILLLYVFFPQNALIITSSLALLATIIAAWELKLPYRKNVTFFLILVAVGVFVTSQNFNLHLSPYKALRQYLRINGTEIIEQYSSPLGLLSVLKSEVIPLRYAPGMSLNSQMEPLDQIGIFTDGDNLSVLTKRTENREQLAYLDQTTSALPYHLGKSSKVLILGAGGGTEILLGKYHTIPDIDAVELNPQIASILEEHFVEYVGNVFDGESSTLHKAEIREYLRKSEENYDIIQISLTDSFGGSTGGLHALSENYLYTLEAMHEYIAHLSPGGYLAITRWIKLPPRDSIKLFATALASLRMFNDTAPQHQLILIRSWQTSTLVIKNGIFSAKEIENVHRFCEKRSFDVAYTSQLSRDQVNLYNILSHPFFYEAAVSLTGNSAANFLMDYKFQVSPATDDRPYFNHFFKWTTLPELIRLRHQGSASMLESGYLVLVATLIFTIFISFVLILFPLWLFQKDVLARLYPINKGHVFSYCFLIGTAFICIEIAFLQKCILFLHHPTFSFSTGLTAFLVFAGLGSQWTQKQNNVFLLKTMKTVISGIALFSVSYALYLDTLFSIFSNVSFPVRVMVIVTIIAPLAFLMGMPFPLALKNLAEKADRLVPWAWAINGCASVIGATFATLFAIHFGFICLILLAVVLYTIAYWVFPTIQPM